MCSHSFLRSEHCLHFQPVSAAAFAFWRLRGKDRQRARETHIQSLPFGSSLQTGLAESMLEPGEHLKEEERNYTFERHLWKWMQRWQVAARVIPVGEREGLAETYRTHWKGVCVCCMCVHAQVFVCVHVCVCVCASPSKLVVHAALDSSKQIDQSVSNFR